MRPATVALQKDSWVPSSGAVVSEFVMIRLQILVFNDRTVGPVFPPFRGAVDTGSVGPHSSPNHIEIVLVYL